MARRTRRRPKPKFVTEPPVRVPPFNEADSSFDELVEKLPAASSDKKARARAHLLLVSREYRISRDLELARVSRSDAAATLRVIGDTGQLLIEALDQLSSDTSAALESMVWGVGQLDWNPGIQAIDTLASMLESVSETAEYLTQINMKKRLNYLDPALAKFVSATRVAASQLGCFPDRAKWSLVLMQQYAELGPHLDSGADDLPLIRATCDNLRLLSMAAAELSKSDRGPQSSTAQMVAVQNLRGFYEWATGKKVTHSRKKGRHYTGALESKFGKFAEAAFYQMEPDPYLRRGLAEAVSYAVWPGRSQAEKPKVELARDKLERCTVEVLAKLRVTNNSSPAP